MIFSIAMGAECLSYLKSIETHARAFSRLTSDGISGVLLFTYAILIPSDVNSLYDFVVVSSKPS